MEQNVELRVANAIKSAVEMHEASWITTNDFGRYTKDWEECFDEACKEHEVPSSLWYILHLANHWSNDLWDWSEEIRTKGNLDSFFADDLDDDDKKKIIEGGS